MKRLGLAAVTLPVVFLTMGSTAIASGGTKVCVPSEDGKPLVTPKKGVCKPHYTLTELGAEGKEGKEGKGGFTAEETALLRNVLSHIRYIATGVGGMPTIQFSGVNVQIVNGEGKTASINGEGNLVIGYGEGGGGEQTGSHNLILGEQQKFTSYGGILAGFGNAIVAPFASVSGGRDNTAEGEDASVVGGSNNTASGQAASVSGGSTNVASGLEASVSGGSSNTASGEDASVSGGSSNIASGLAASIFGGTGLEAGEPSEAIP